jgi:aspartate racemase
MARRYLEEILAANPEGPYLLAGTCMGGLVAFELACRLVEQGREVRFVGLMDTTAPPFGGRRSPWVEMIVDPFRDTLRIARWAALRSVGYGRGGDSLPAYRHFIGSITSRARYYYRPRCYPGTITMFSTTETAYPRGDRRQLMAQYATDMRTIPIPARREELFLPPAVDELARQLQACLEVAEGGIRSVRPPTPRLAGS